MDSSVNIKIEGIPMNTEYAVLNDGDILPIPYHLHGIELLEWSNDYIPEGIVWKRVIGSIEERESRSTEDNTLLESRNKSKVKARRSTTSTTKTRAKSKTSKNKRQVNANTSE